MIATIILFALVFIKLGVRCSQSKNISEIISNILACIIMLTLYYFAGLFDKFF